VPPDLASRSDEALVAAARGGETAAFEALIARHFGLVQKIALARLRESDTADDVAQETMVRAYLALDRLRDPARFAPWLCQIARNLAMDWRTKITREDRVICRLPIEEHAESLADERGRGGRETMQAEETSAALQSALGALPEPQREVILLRYAEEMTQQQIAERLGVNQATVSRLMRRALDAMRLDLAPILRSELPRLRAKRAPAMRATAAVFAVAALAPTARAALASKAAAAVPVSSALGGATLTGAIAMGSAQKAVIIGAVVVAALVTVPLAKDMMGGGASASPQSSLSVAANQGPVQLDSPQGIRMDQGDQFPSLIIAPNQTASINMNGAHSMESVDFKPDTTTGQMIVTIHLSGNGVATFLAPLSRGEMRGASGSPTVAFHVTWTKEGENYAVQVAPDTPPN